MNEQMNEQQSIEEMREALLAKIEAMAKKVLGEELYQALDMDIVIHEAGNLVLRRADGSRGVTLTLAGMARMYPTPMASDVHGGRIYRQPPSKDGSPKSSEVTPGPLNPEWVEWLMGFPVGWTDLGD